VLEVKAQFEQFLAYFCLCLLMSNSQPRPLYFEAPFFLFLQQPTPNLNYYYLHHLYLEINVSALGQVTHFVSQKTAVFSIVGFLDFPQTCKTSNFAAHSYFSNRNVMIWECMLDLAKFRGMND